MVAHQACFTRLISSPRHLNPISLRLLTVLQSCRRSRSVGKSHDAECRAVLCSVVALGGLHSVLRLLRNVGMQVIHCCTSYACMALFKAGSSAWLTRWHSLLNCILAWPLPRTSPNNSASSLNAVLHVARCQIACIAVPRDGRNASVPNTLASWRLVGEIRCWKARHYP